MKYNTSAHYIPSIFFFFASILLYAGSAAAVDTANLPIQEARQIVWDEAHSTMFILNGDSTISAYDFIRKTFIVTRRALPGVQNVHRMIVSQKGSFIGVLSGANGFLNVNIFKTQDMLVGNKALNSLTNYFIEADTADGVLAGRFSDDEKSLFLIVDGKNVFVLKTSGDTPGGNTFNTGTKRDEKIAVGDLPIIMDTDSSGHLLTLNQKSEDVSVIDVSKKAVIGKIHVGSLPKNLIFNTVTKMAYVSHTGSDDIYVINPATFSVVKKITIGGNPLALAYDKTTGDVFVASNSSGIVHIVSPDFKVGAIDLQSPGTSLGLWHMQSTHTLFILNRSTAKLFAYDMAQSRIVNEQKIPPNPAGIIGSEKINSVFVGYSNAMSLFMLNASTFAAIKIPENVMIEMPFFSRPQSITMDEERNRIFVSNLDNDIITMIDGNTQKPIAKIHAVNAPQTISFNPVTGKLYAVSSIEGAVAAVDTLKKDYPVTIIPVGKQPRILYINQATNRIYISNAGDSTVHVIDGSTNTDIATIPMPSKSLPSSVQGNDSSNKIYVNLYNIGSIGVINGASQRVEKLIPVGQDPVWLRPISKAHRLIVSVEGERKIAVIDMDKDEVVKTVNLSGAPYRVFFDERTSYIYVNFRRENKVAIIAPDATFSNFTLLKEMNMPYWGQTDARPYNMASGNSKTNLAYFSNGRGNSVIVIKDELDDQGIKKPLYYATILATGEVLFAPGAQISPTAISTQMYLYGMGALVLLSVIIYALIRRTRKWSSMSL